MSKELQKSRQWLPIPDRVVVLLGRFVYYSAWLDDVMGEAVIHGNVSATALSDSTPGWASSGKALVAAVRLIQIDHQLIDDLADRLDILNAIRNQLVHGVWLWRDDSVMVMKRSLGKGERQVEYATFAYEEIEGVVEQYKELGEIVDRLVALLMKGNPASLERDGLSTPNCPTDLTPMGAVVQNEVIVWKCQECGLISIA
jgi:hypothetical protein